MIPLFLMVRGHDRNEFEQIKKLVTRLKAAGAQTRASVGAGVQLANSDFMRQFSNLEGFRSVSLEQRKRFLAELSDLELDLANHEVRMAMGVGLYRIWLADTLAQRRHAAALLGEELTELSRKAATA